MTETIETFTVHTTSRESKEGKTFLRKVMKSDLDWAEAWRVHASASTKWCATFQREIKGKTGESDRTIQVETDISFSMPEDSRFGMVRSFSDSKEVMVSRPRYIWLNGGAAITFVKLALDGCDFRIEASAGSTHSSQCGISLYWLAARLPNRPYSDAQVGGTTVAKDGHTLIAGAVDIY